MPGLAPCWLYTQHSGYLAAWWGASLEGCIMTIQDLTTPPAGDIVWHSLKWLFCVNVIRQHRVPITWVVSEGREGLIILGKEQAVTHSYPLRANSIYLSNCKFLDCFYQFNQRGQGLDTASYWVRLSNQGPENIPTSLRTKGYLLAVMLRVFYIKGSNTYMGYI